MNLIEELGLEKCKAIDGMLQKHAVPESWKIAVINGMWQRSSVGFTHGELRTAIASHEPKMHSHLTSIELQDGDTDNCTDIRNHISPRTIVWDLASGKDWSVEVNPHG